MMNLMNKDFSMMIFSNALFQNHIFLFILMFLVMIIFPLSILKISQKVQRITNELSLGFQDKKTAIEHPLIIFKQEPLDLPCLKILDKKEKSRETYKVIYDSYFDDDDVDLSQLTQQSSDNERYFNSIIISVNPHFKVKDHLHDFTIQDNTPIYDSYHEESSIPICNHNLVPDSQNLASSCEERDVTSRSQFTVTLFL